MAEPTPQQTNPFDDLYTPDELDRQRNTGQYERGLGYYLRANAREVGNSLFGNPDKLRNANSVSDVIEGIMPGGLSGLYSMADLAFTAAQDAAPTAEFFLDGKQPKPVHLPGGEAATRMYEESRKYANDRLGVEEIEGTGDFVAGVLPTIFAPGPKLDKAKSVLGKTAEFGASMVLPFSQSKFGTVRHGIETGLPLVISEGAAAVGDLPLEVYDSALRTDEPGSEQKPLEVLNTPSAAAPPGGFRPSDFADLYTDPDNLEGMPGDDTQEAWFETREAQFAAGTAMALVAARLATHGRGLLRRRPPVPHPDQISGEVPFENVLGKDVYAAKYFVDKNAPMPAAIKHEGGSADDVEEMAANVGAMMNPVSQSNIGTTAKQLGIFPGMQRKVEPLGRIMRTVGNLGDDGANAFGRAMAALDIVSRMRPGQILNDMAGGSWDAARLNKIIHDAQQIPGVAAAMARTRKWYDDMREVLQVNGIIDPVTAARWAAQQPHFVHTQLNFRTDDDVWKQFLVSMTTKHEAPITDSAVLHALSARELDPQKGVLPGAGQNMLETMEKYGESVVRAVLENNNKRYFFHQIERLARARGTKSNLVKRVEKPGKNTVSFFRHGKEVHYQIRDEALYSTLLNQPVMVVPVLNAARSMVHFWATGAGNPFFVWKSAMFDTLLSPFTRMSGDSLGPLDEIIRRASGGKYDMSNFVGIDPTVVANWPVGSARFLYGAFIKEMGERLDASINANTIFARSLNALGVPADAVLKVIDDAYMRSTHFLWNSVGGGANAGTLATPEALRASISQSAPNVVGYLHRMDTNPVNPRQAMLRAQARITAHSGWRAYTALMNALHNGVKFQHFAANTVPKTGQTAAMRKKQVIRAGKASRELTVDPSRTGDGWWYRAYASSALWGNIGVQSLYQFSRAFRDHPYRMATMLSATGFATLGWLNQMFGGDEDAAKYYFQTLTPSQRVQLGIPMYVDERGDIQYLPVDPMLRPLIAMTTELYGALAGHTAAMPRDDEQRTLFTRAVNEMFGGSITEKQEDDIFAGMATGAVNALPGLDVPVINLGMKQAGLTTQNSAVPWMMQRGQMFVPERDSLISPVEERTVEGVMPKFIENVMTEMLGSFGRKMVDGVNTFSRVSRTDATPLQAADAAYTQWLQSTKDTMRGQPPYSLWFGQTNDKKIDTFNEIAARNRSSLDGIEKIMKWGEKGASGANATGGMISRDLPGTSVSIAEQGLLTLYSAVAPFREQLARPTELIRDLRAELEDIEKAPLLSLRPDQQRARANDLRMQILDQQVVIYHLIQQFEDAAGKNIGKPFRLHDFDPADWTDEDAIQQSSPLPPQR